MSMCSARTAAPSSVPSSTARPSWPGSCRAEKRFAATASDGRGSDTRSSAPWSRRTPPPRPHSPRGLWRPIQASRSPSTSHTRRPPSGPTGSAPPDSRSSGRSYACAAAGTPAPGFRSSSSPSRGPSSAEARDILNAPPKAAMNRPRSSKKRYRLFVEDYKHGRLDDPPEERKNGSGPPKPEADAETKAKNKVKRREYLREYAHWLWPHRYAVGALFGLAL